MQLDEYKWNCVIDLSLKPETIYCDPQGNAIYSMDVNHIDDLIEQRIAEQMPDDPYINPIALRVVFYLSYKRGYNFELSSYLIAIENALEGLVINSKTQITSVMMFREFVKQVPQSILISVSPLEKTKKRSPKQRRTKETHK